MNPTIRDLPKIFGELERRIAQQFPGELIYVEGEYVAQRDASEKITNCSIIILIFVRVLLFSYFGSINFVLQVITDIPLFYESALVTASADIIASIKV